MANNEQKITYIPSKTGLRFHREKDKLVRLLKGPVGSGKSVACCWEVFDRIIHQKDVDGYRRSRWAIIRATIPELKTTTIKTWLGWFGKFTTMKYGSPITGHVRVPLPDGSIAESELIFLAQNHESDAEKLKSLELTGVYFNEASEIGKESFDMATTRIKRYPAKREGGANFYGIILDSNSFDEDHWLYDVFYRNKPELYELYDQPPALVRIDEEGVIRYEQHPEAENIEHLNDGINYYLDQIQGKSKSWVDVIVMNKIGTAKDGDYVYTEYLPDYCGNHTKKTFDEMIPELYWTHDQNFFPMSSAILQKINGIDYVVDEIILSSAGASQVASEFCERYKGYRGVVYIHGDRFGRQGEKHGVNSYYSEIVDILTRQGFRVQLDALKQNPPIRDSQDSLRARICDAYGLRSLMVNPEKAPTVDKGLQKVALKPGSSFIEIEEFHQHVTTALRYYTYKQYSQKKGSIKIGSFVR